MSSRLKHKVQDMRLEDRRTVKTEQPAVTKERIRRRAHQLYLARGQKPVDPLHDWLQAEEEL